MLKYYYFIFILLGCTSQSKNSLGLRKIAYSHQKSEIKILANLSQETVFANGVNSVFLEVAIKDENGKGIEIDPTELKVVTDTPVDTKKFNFKDGVYQTSIKPQVRSNHIKIYIAWKDVLGPQLELKTTLAPMSQKMIPLKSSPRSFYYINGVYHGRNDNLSPGQFEAMQITNFGKNRIVSIKDSSRVFDFSFNEQANQNNSLTVTDSPNGTNSHMMLSHFMFFPRRYLPFVEKVDGQNKFTLPTGEDLIISDKGEILSGVFEEGPVDIGPDRFKRQYADLKYTGKGILIRANARGQMPQQGQFETNKIDMEFGIKFSSDVLIINGTTGKRCLRPKIDFWPTGDVNPILFKFPTDEEFDSYLKNKCGFGIPQLTLGPQLHTKEETSQLESEIWNKCEEKALIKDCLELEIETISSERIKSKVRFEILKKLSLEIHNEKLIIPSELSKEIIRITPLLINDKNWPEYPKEEHKFIPTCIEKSKSLVTLKFKHHQADNLIEDKIISNCTKNKSELITQYINEEKKEIDSIKKILDSEMISINQNLLKNPLWITSFLNEDIFQKDCLNRTYVITEIKPRYQGSHQLLAESFKNHCVNIRSDIKLMAKKELPLIKEKIESDFSWVNSVSSDAFLRGCQIRARSLLHRENHFFDRPEIYHNQFSEMCLQVESSGPYKIWIDEQTTGIEDKIFNRIVVTYESLAFEKADECVKKFPLSSQIDRIRFKKERDQCFLSFWSVIEEEIMNEIKKDPLLKKVNFSFEEMGHRLGAERAKLLVKIKKKYSN